MKNRRHQRWPDGTRVRFKADAREAMIKKFPWDLPLQTPGNGSDAVYTVDNTPDSLHDVILRETGERYGITWLEQADQ